MNNINNTSNHRLDLGLDLTLSLALSVSLNIALQFPPDAGAVARFAVVIWISPESVIDELSAREG